MRKRIPGSLISVGALIWAMPASAQQAAPAGNTEQSQAGPELPDIVVTAQRREQSLQDVPISVTAFTAESIKALDAQSVGDLDNFTPGLEINDTSVTQPSYTIRGVKTDDFGIGTEPSVGIFVDGVYAARSGSALIFFNDIARVEVLKGPQGTLFGRNTSAGAISIVTNKPSDQLTAFGTIQGGSYGKVRIDATGNVPITDTLYLRVNGVFNRRNGYLHDAVTGEDRERQHNMSGRAALRWAPSTSTDFVLTYDHDDTNKDGPASIGVSSAALSQDPFGPFTNDVIGNRETRILNAVTLTGRHDFGPVSLTSISAYKAFQTHNREDEDGTGDPTRYLDTENIEHNKSFYQELRLSYDGDTLKALLGASYYWEHGTQTSAVTLLTDSVDNVLGQVAGFPIFTILDSVGLPVFGKTFREDMNNDARNKSFAVYGDATYDISSKLSVTAGIRYTHDRKSFGWENGPYIAPALSTIMAPGALYNAILGVPAFPDAVNFSVADFFNATVGPNGIIFDEGALEGVPFRRTESFNDVSPRFVLNYKPNKDVLLYASASRGYKAGGFNSQQINSFFRPENVWNFEGGVKSELFGRRLKLNASGYYFKYKNRQSISLESVPGSALPQYTTVSGDSQAWGIDFETQFVLTRDLTLGLTGGYINSTWVTRTERGADISGQPTGEPLFRGVLSAHYSHRMDGGGRIFADASYSYTSKIRINDSDRVLLAGIAPYVDYSKLKKVYADRNIANARVGYSFPGDHLTISVFGDNILGDQAPRTLNDISAEFFHTPYVRLDEPATFGVELGLKF